MTMTDQTRSDRVNKPRDRRSSRHRSTPKATSETQPFRTTPTRQTRSQRVRQKGGRSSRQERQPKATKAAKKAAPVREPKVDRIDNDIYFTTVETHLAFVADGSLATDQNTETIALNVMDHVIQPENWDASLSRNVLRAACFYFASMVTGRQNVASSVAASLNWYWEQVIESQQTAWYVNEQARLVMSVTVDEVEKGYALLLDQRERLEDLVGDFKSSLAHLPTRDAERHVAVGDHEQLTLDKKLAADEELLALTGEGSWDAGSHACIEDDSAIDDQVDRSELDDFDWYVADNG
ncbi:hypothetical protein DOTSEDRAFT_30069 [Dothistroma septosporum NZE10]|uniref:Uncharacterized protein n=1 Tax=Dothistroma septosporum (strain NZE10 / CBS 128990) TaxID=675120 RepID=N1PYT6_DOTSN|nr:hypothetical protein DOTSEDRAFT_30069 [Dothistroma septosporum NZE10]